MPRWLTEQSWRSLLLLLLDFGAQSGSGHELGKIVFHHAALAGLGQDLLGTLARFFVCVSATCSKFALPMRSSMLAPQPEMPESQGIASGRQRQTLFSAGNCRKLSGRWDRLRAA
jgi:hypothetical protein